MKVLNYNISSKELTISKQVALKNIFVKDILDVTMRDNNIFNIYELDNMYTPQNLNILSQIAASHIDFIHIMHKIVNRASNKEAVKIATPLSMHLQGLYNKLYKEALKYQATDLNSFLLLHFPYPKVDKIMMKYIEDHPHSTLEYNEIINLLRPQCSTIDIRKFLFLGCAINYNQLFPSATNIIEKSKIEIDRQIYLKETNRIPDFLNILMGFCVWGMHVLFERGSIKHILFFNPYNDIIILNYRRGSSGCTKVDFFIAVPLDQVNSNDEIIRTQQIHKFISDNYIKTNRYADFE